MATEIYDIPSIHDSIMRLSEHLTGVRKEALLNILLYAQKYPLPLEDGDILKSGILKMFVEKQPHVYSQFVDTVEAILQHWSSQVQGWIYMIISKFLHKLGADIIKDSLDQKIRKLLITMTNYSTGSLVLSCIFRAFADPSQPMNRKTITVSLLYLGQMCRKLEQGNFNRCDESSSGFTVIAGWYANKNAFKDIQRTSRKVLLSLFCLNSSTFLQLQTELPITKEPFVRQLINDHILHSDGMSPSDGEECIFFSQVNGIGHNFEDPQTLREENQSSTIKSTKSFQSFLEVPGDIPKRPVSSEETSKSYQSFAKRSSTLPRKPSANPRIPMRKSPTIDDKYSPIKSKLSLSRTMSNSDKKQSRSKDNKDSPSYRQSPKLDISYSRLPRLATLEDDNPLSFI
ncbi:CLIP-associating protein 1 isoform X6 [Oopsacas minuta]|uniref:CLIP-associating protein 1 isoform X6 n=1 Tax=Oopsacas minuta TaxID=111878 RepID=A0AAV7JQ15_9METZ|nr:CLIP-associating protein 1 isoform X6 [Oopsacas minuta]